MHSFCLSPLTSNLHTIIPTPPPVFSSPLYNHRHPKCILYKNGKLSPQTAATQSQQSNTTYSTRLKSSSLTSLQRQLCHMTTSYILPRVHISTSHLHYFAASTASTTHNPSLGINTSRGPSFSICPPKMQCPLLTTDVNTTSNCTSRPTTSLFSTATLAFLDVK